MAFLNTKNTILLDIGLKDPNQDRSSCLSCVFWVAKPLWTHTSTSNGQPWCSPWLQTHRHYALRWSLQCKQNCFNLQKFLGKQIFHVVKVPPDAPTKGTNSKASKLLGRIFLRKAMSLNSFFVSWMQTISHIESNTLFLIQSHFLLALTPLMF